MKVYVITWRYWDNSGSGVVDVFSSLEEANKILGYLETHGRDRYEVHETEMKTENDH